MIKETIENLQKKFGKEISYLQEGTTEGESLIKIVLPEISKDFPEKERSDMAKEIVAEAIKHYNKIYLLVTN